MKKTETLVYIAGPYRGNVGANVIRAQFYAQLVGEKGVGFICPHSNRRPHDNAGFSEEYWLQTTREIMRRCDALFVVPRWESSRGTRGEIAEAERLGIPVFDDLMTLGQWVRGICD
jgi:hypothetical protein